MFGMRVSLGECVCVCLYLFAFLYICVSVCWWHSFILPVYYGGCYCRPHYLSTLQMQIYILDSLRGYVCGFEFNVVCDHAILALVASPFSENDTRAIRMCNDICLWMCAIHQEWKKKTNLYSYQFPHKIFARNLCPNVVWIKRTSELRVHPPNTHTSHIFVVLYTKHV